MKKSAFQLFAAILEKSAQANGAETPVTMGQLASAAKIAINLEAIGETEITDETLKSDEAYLESKGVSVN